MREKNIYTCMLINDKQNRDRQRETKEKDRENNELTDAPTLAHRYALFLFYPHFNRASPLSINTAPPSVVKPPLQNLVARLLLAIPFSAAASCMRRVMHRCTPSIRGQKRGRCTRAPPLLTPSF